MDEDEKSRELILREILVEAVRAAAGNGLIE